MCVCVFILYSGYCSGDAAENPLEVVMIDQNEHGDFGELDMYFISGSLVSLD